MTDGLLPAGDRWALRFTRVLAHPPEKVWRAITEPEHLSRWYPLTATALDPRPGGTIRFRDDDGTELRADITEFRPPALLAFTEHDEETGDHDLRIELEPDVDGCRMTFTHTFADRSWADRTETGWVGCLEELAHLLAEPAQASSSG